MIRLKDLSLQNRAGLGISCFLAMAKKYNPLINYNWSTTTTSGLRYLKDSGSTPTYNASMYFGRGAYLNGVDQTITVPINTTIQTALKRVNGVVTINETSQALTNYVISGLGVHKDYYLFTRLLTTAEKDNYINTPELFYAMAQADSNCVLNMPMCENSSTSRNYKTGTNYPILNYTSSVRGNAKSLQYGLQTCKFVRDSLGVIQSASNYLECDGVGYGNTGWIVDTTKDFTIEFTKYVDHRSDASDWLSQESGLYSKLRITTSKYSGGWLQVTVDNNLASINISTLQGTFVSVVVVAVAGSNFKVYVNKVLKSTTTLVNTVVDTQGFRLGSGLSWSTNGAPRNFEKNPITKFKVHNKALTNEEIQAL